MTIMYGFLSVRSGCSIFKFQTNFLYLGELIIFLMIDITTHGAKWLISSRGEYSVTLLVSATQFWMEIISAVTG